MINSNIKMVILILVLAVGAFWAGSLSSTNKLDEFIEQYDEWQNKADVATKFANEQKIKSDSLEAVINSKDTVIQQSNMRVARLSTQRNNFREQLEELQTDLGASINCEDSLTTSTNIIVNLNKQLASSDSTIVENEIVIGSQLSQLRDERLRVVFQTDRADELQTILNLRPDTPSNPNKLFGFIPKPSRTVVAVVSLAAGTYVGYRIGKDYKKE